MPDSRKRKRGESSGRLSPIPHEEALRPLRRAKQADYCHLYWISLTSFPVPERQRIWLVEFLDRLVGLFVSEVGLREETFLEAKTAINSPLTDVLTKFRDELVPNLGLSRRPGGALPKGVSKKDLEDLSKFRKAFSYDDFMPDYCYWFMLGDGKKHRELSFGHGGLTTLLMEPDDEKKLPGIPRMKAFEQPPFKTKVSMNDMIALAERAQDGFQEKSRQLFGEDLADDAENNDIPFVIPRLSSKDFFSQPEEERQKWFDLFGGYIRESIEDRGLLVASAVNVEDQIVTILNTMKEEGFVYPEA